MQRIYLPVFATLMMFFVMALVPTTVHAQCKAFVKSNCQSQLTPFIHDGSYQAVIMNEGEEAELYKTIFAGQHYRLFLCSDNSLPGVEFVVSDIHRNILFDNRKNGNAKQWDFKADASQQIKVTVRIPKAKQQGSSEQELLFGCVGILFGIMDK